MKLNQDKLERIYRCMYSPKMRAVLKKIYENEPLVYSDIREICDKAYNKKTGLTAFYVKKLSEANLLMRQGHNYYLTRTGVQVIELTKCFEKICVEYELDECDGEGTIKMTVVNRKMGRLKLEV